MMNSVSFFFFFFFFFFLRLLQVTPDLPEVQKLQKEKVNFYSHCKYMNVSYNYYNNHKVQ